MIKVLHYIPGFSYGGIESIFLSWYKNLNREEITFELLLRSQDEDAICLKEFRNLGGTYYRLPRFSITKPYEYRKSMDDFFSKHRDYDILHVHSEDHFVLSSAKRHGIRNIIVHSHSSGRDKGIRSFLKAYDGKIGLLLYADYGFACSEMAAKYKFGDDSFKGHTVSIIRNAIDCKSFEFNKAVRKEIRDQLYLGDKYVLGHIGRLTTAKNQFYLISIFNEYLKLNANALLMIIGDGPLDKALKEYASQLNILEKILFLGSRKDVAKLLQGIDCFLLPSKREGMPITLIEAQAAGLPCVISSNITTEADVTDLITRISIKEAPLNWAAKIEKIRHCKKRRNTVKQIIESGFDIKESTQRLTDRYSEIIQQKDAFVYRG